MIATKSEIIFEGINSTVYLQEESDSNQPLIVKVMREDHPSAEQITAFFNEFDIINGLEIKDIRKAIKKTKIDGKPALVLEYVQGTTLKDFFGKKKRSLKETLCIAVKICQVLGEIHQHNIIHKDVDANNILITDEGDVKIIDFGLSSKINLKTQNLGNPEKLEGTLPYISPEQTGRMNRVVDYRSDLYSLGVIMYEMLTYRLPFEETDVMALVHAHLAQTAEAPHLLDNRIPEILSDIVLKLLRKNAEDRYQSAFGLKADLEKCLFLLEETGKVQSFELGKDDYSGKLQIPQKLYGRHRELGLLLDSFEKACQGTTELVLISGYSGVGKTALVHEIHKPITERRGFFVEGKFDQFQRNVPYSAWLQAFKSFIGHILTQSPSDLEKWRAKIQLALGNNGAVLIDVLPSLELILGKQPLLTELGGAEAQNRFSLVFQNFIHAICRRDHPLVIFIDDWQWADSASLNLLKILLENCDEDYLLIIGAYRDNEVSPSHQFVRTIDEIRKEAISIQSLEIMPLAKEHLYNLISETLNLPNVDVEEFTDLVYQKTQGNAFFVNQMLKSLYEENLLKFNFEKKRWTWEIDQIKALNITDNVVNLMANKIQRLPMQTQEILKLATCIGNRFSLATLAIIDQDTEELQTRRVLEPALIEGLVIPLEKDFKFSHDRIQQAVYSLISEEERKSVHLRIGRLLVEHIPADMREKYIFDIVNQWNLGIELIHSKTDKHFLAELNLIAGKKAKDSAAYMPAFNHLQIAVSLLENDIWEIDYDFALSIFSEALNTAFLKGQLDLTEQYIELLKANAQSTLDKMPAFEIEMQYHIAQGNQQKALEAGMRVVEMLDVQLSDTAPLGVDVEQLLELPLMQDAGKQAAMEIMDSIVTPAWASDPEMFQKITYTMVNLSIQYGNSASACVGYAFYGGLLCALGDIDTGYRFGRLAVNLLDKIGAKFFKAKVDNLYISTVMHWKEPARATRKLYAEAVQVGLETGEIEFASYNIVESCHYHFLMGIGLEALQQKYEKDLLLIRQLKQEFHINYLAPFQQMVANLVGDTAHVTRLKGEFFDEDLQLPTFIEEQQLTLTFVSYQAKTILAYIFEDYDLAYQNVMLAEKYKDGVVGMLHLTTHNLFYSLILIARFPNVQLEEKQAYLKQIDRNQQDLKIWTKHCPANCQHKFDLITAETMRLSGQVIKAMDYYDKAIEGARNSLYLYEEAIINELTAKFYLERQKDKVAKTYLMEAYHKFQLWGAVRKLEQMEVRYERFLRQKSTNQNAMLQTTHANSSKLANLDINTIIKASQALSGEVVLSNLLQKMMRIVVENAGAEKGFYITQKGNDWYVEAECDIQKQEVSALKSVTIESVNGLSEIPKLSSEVVNYVVRTRETLVLNDASNERRIIGKNYVDKCNPKSILCMPLIYQNKISGIIYLENNLTTDAFTPDRMEVLEILSSQIAISYENALLYENLEEKVRERTAEVMLQKEIIEKKNHDITSSINYAKRIQDATLLRIDEVKKILGDSFILFKPRDIVSGDFYWCTKTDTRPIYEEEYDYEETRRILKGFENEKIIITAVDCTGHGVPGAFMSMIGNNLLYEIVDLMGITQPNRILEELHRGVRTALKQNESENKDGMDMSLCTIDLKKRVVEYAGAKNSLIYIQNGQINEIKADKMPIGGVQKEEERLFTNHYISLTNDGSLTTFYLLSDGFQDQFGGEQGRKFMIKYLKELLLKIHEKPMIEQKQILERTINEWMYGYRQIDDILMIGFRL